MSQYPYLDRKPGDVPRMSPDNHSPFPDQEEEPQAGLHAEERQQPGLSNDLTITDLKAALQAFVGLVSKQQTSTFRVQSGHRPAVLYGIYVQTAGRTPGKGDGFYFSDGSIYREVRCHRGI